MATDTTTKKPGSELSSSAFPPSWSVCVICKSLPKSSEVSFFPCLHICCSSDCTDRFFAQPPRKYAWSCPECYQKVHKDALHSCSYINENLENDSKEKGNSYDSQLCRSCVREALAHKWCQDCQEFLCEFCSDYHLYGKATRTHVLAPRSEGIIELSEGSEASPTDLKCKTHLEEDINSICEDCKIPMCQICNDAHSGHKCKTLDVFAEEFQAEFEAGLNNVKWIKEKCELAVRAFDEKLQYILRDQKSSMHAEAKRVFKRLIDALLQREIQLRKDLVEITLNKAKEINIKKAKVSSIVKSCTQYMTSGKEILEKGSRLNVFQHKDYIQNQYKNLDSMRNVLQDESFDDFIEADWAFEIRHEPVELAEKWIGQICEVVYAKKTKGQQPIAQKNDDKSSNKSTPKISITSPVAPEKPKVNENSRSVESRQKAIPRATYKKSSPGTTSSVVENNTAGEPMDIDRASKTTTKSPQTERPTMATRRQSAVHADKVIIKQEPNKDKSDSEEPPLTPPITRKRASSSDKVALQPSPESPDPKRGIALDRPRRTIKVPKDKEIDIGSPEVKKSSRNAAKSRTTSEERSGGRSSCTGKTSEPASKRERSLTVPPPKSSPKATSSAKKTAKHEEKSATVTPIASGSRKSTRGRPPKRGQKDSENGAEGDATPMEITGEVIEFPIVREEKMKISMEDENEDYCGTCLDGGEEVLICCDKCPKVFHLECHLPSLSAIPKEDFQCFFCTPYEVLREKKSLVNGEKDYLIVPKSGLSFHEFIIACKFFCELYKIKESLTVRGFYDKMFRQQINQAPISLTSLRRRLTLGVPKPFDTTSSIILNLKKLLYQANIFYSVGSEENQQYLQQFQDKLEDLLGIYFPLLCDLRYEPEEDEEFLPLVFIGQEGKNAQTKVTTAAGSE